MNPARAPEPRPVENEDTGLPWPRTWRGLYLLVVSSFALWVALLITLTRAFA